MPAPSLSTLPEELLLMVVSHLDKEGPGRKRVRDLPTVLTLAKVCRRLAEVLLPTVYRKVTLNHCIGLEKRLLILSWMILTNPTRGALINEFACRVSGESATMDEAFQKMRISAVREVTAAGPAGDFKERQRAFYKAFAAKNGDDKMNDKDAATGKQIITTWNLREYDGMPEFSKAQGDVIRQRLRELFPDENGYKRWEYNILERQYFTAILVFAILHMKNLWAIRVRPDDNEFWEVLSTFVDALNKPGCKSQLSPPLQNLRLGYLTAKRWREAKASADLSPLKIFTALPNMSDLIITRLRTDEDESSQAAREYINSLQARSIGIPKLQLAGSCNLSGAELKKFLEAFRKLVVFSYDMDISIRPPGAQALPDNLPSLSPSLDDAIRQHSDTLESLVLVINQQRGRGTVPESAFTAISFKNYGYLKRLVISPEFFIVKGQNEYYEKTDALVRRLPRSTRDLVISVPTSLRMSKREYVRYMEAAVDALLQAKAGEFLQLRMIALDLTYRTGPHPVHADNTDNPHRDFTIDEYDTLFHVASDRAQEAGVKLLWREFNKRWDEDLESFVYIT